MWKLVNREKFVKDRYERFLEKKKMIQEQGLEKLVHLTDLDKDYGDGKMRDIVICDCCNENVNDEKFLMLEDVKVYHMECAVNYMSEKLVEHFANELRGRVVKKPELKIVKGE